MIHQEELALIVPHHLAEPKRAVNDLLRRSHSQGRLLRKLLEAWPIAVHRRHIEVGPELAHRLLRVLRHVELAA